MTPFSLNPQGPSFPLTDRIEDQNQFFFSPINQDSSSLSGPSFFNILDQTQNRQTGELRHDQEDEKPVLHGGPSNHQVCPTSSVPVKNDSGSVYGRNLSFYKTEEEESKSSYESLKWMPLKMRLMRKMMNPTNPEASNINQTPRQENSHRSPANNGNSTTRVCSDCNTTSTPLWRSGPRGPKSLCNACGIRQRKARRALAEATAAENGVAACTDASSTKSRVHSKEKKPRTNHFAQHRHKCKPIDTASTSQEIRKLGFKDFGWSLSYNWAFGRGLPQDEVAEAALLLMDLSCGFVHF